MNVAVTGPVGRTTRPEEQTDFRPLARALGTVVDFPADEVIFREGDPPHCVVVVLEGKVEVSAKLKAIETIHEGQALGILSLIDEKPRTITARAVEPCELALLDKKQFRFLVEEAPHVVWLVMDELGWPLRAASALA